MGTSGADAITGTTDDDVIVGLGGDDVITGLVGDDFICGGPGNDDVKGGRGSDSVFGEEDNDVLKANPGKRDWLSGGSGNDYLAGTPGASGLLGGADDDEIVGGWVRFSDSPNPVSIDLEAGTATGFGNDLIVDPTVVSGSYHDDILVGSSDQDSLDGSLGADRIEGLGAGDGLFGGPGNDDIRGGGGPDQIYGCDAARCPEPDDDVISGGPGRDLAGFYSEESPIIVDLSTEIATGQETTKSRGSKMSGDLSARKIDSLGMTVRTI